MWRIIGCVSVLLIFSSCSGAQNRSVSDAYPAKVTCPVMKSSFTPTAKTAKVQHQGKTYYFCCPGCDKKFLANPSKYVPGAPAAKPTPTKSNKADCGDACDDCDDSSGAEAAPAKVDSASGGLKIGTAGQLKVALPASAICAVTKEKMKPTASSLVATAKGKVYWLCCKKCVNVISKAPHVFIK